MPGSPSSLPTLTWWDSLMLFLGLGGKDKEKYLILKGIRNNLKIYGKKYFHVGQDLADPSLAKLFHEIYVCIGPAQSIFLNLSNSPALKNILIEGMLSEDALIKLRSLDEEAITAKSQQMPIEKLTEECQQNLALYSAYFTPEIVRKIESRFRTLQIFFDLLKFNFYFFLKKFDSNLPERDFNYRPRFEKIHGSYIVEDLKEFWEVASHLPLQADWDGIFDTLKAYKNVEPVNRGLWKKVLQNFRILQESDVIPLIIQYVSQDLTYQVLSKPEKENIVEQHLNALKTRNEVTLSKIRTHKRRLSIGKLATDIFGNEAVFRAKNYVEKANTIFSKKNVGTYTLVDAFNFLKAFLIDYGKKDLRELVNFLVIKGQWFEMNNSKILSEGLHRIMELSEKVVSFDDSLAEEGERGSRIKSHIIKSDRDTNAQSIVRNLIKDINNLVKTYLLDTGNEMINLGKVLKAVIEDMSKPKHELIGNWKQLETGYDGNLKEALINIYKKIYNFVQLIQYYTKEN
jgi:hypothetical protein